MSVPGRLLAGKEKLLTTNLAAIILILDDQPIGVRLPPNVVLKVIEAHEAVAGNRINAPKKPVIMETGLEIQAPLFIKTGDKLSIDTDTGEYLARVN